MNILILDNFDSFTFNLYQYVGEILTSYHNNFQLIVKRNNEISLDEIKMAHFDKIIISPGAGSPDDGRYFGVCGQVISQIKDTPILGVCLGMQGIAHFFGGKVVRCKTPMHGKTSTIIHDNQGIYQNLPQHLQVMRYHSLMVDACSLPDCFWVSSVAIETTQQAHTMQAHTTPDDLLDYAKQGYPIMGIRHKDYPIEGVQYHPESFASEGAKQQLMNFLGIADK